MRTVKPYGLDLQEAIFLTALYEGRAFMVSRGKFVRDVGMMIDGQLAHQSNGVIKVVER